MELDSSFRKSAEYAAKTLAVLGGLLAAFVVAALCITLHLLLEDRTVTYHDDAGVLWDIAFLFAALLIYGTCIAPRMWRRRYLRPRVSPPDAVTRDGDRRREVGSPLFTDADALRETAPPNVGRPAPTWPASAFASRIGRVQLIRTPVSPFLLPEALPTPSVDAYALPSEHPTIPGGFACAPVIEAPDPVIEVTGEEDADPDDFEEEPWAKA